MFHWHCHFCYKKTNSNMRVYPNVSGLSHNEITTINTHWEATQRVMVAKLTRLSHKIAIQLHLVVESCTICSSCPRQPVQKLLDTLLYRDERLTITCSLHYHPPPLLKSYETQNLSGHICSWYDPSLYLMVKRNPKLMKKFTNRNV
jgi:hypothetical protein